MTPAPTEQNLDGINIKVYTSDSAANQGGAQKGGIAIETKPKEPAFGGNWLTVRQVAEMRNVSRQAVHEAIKDGRLPAEPVLEIGNQTFYRIHREVAEQWDDQIARTGRGARKRKIPKTEKPARRKLVLASP
jgi:excisionase family DNA binding protein